MEKYKQNSLDLIAKREKQIKFLELKIINNKKLIDKSKQKLDSLSRLKNKVNVIYVNKVKEINDFNSNQLENYFNEELN
jgi:Trk K+ transport system NAD-binding subunit